VLKVGITGGIGSGKTTVSGIIERLGYPVYASDAAAARLVNDDAATREALSAAFGKKIYPPAGTLDRPRLATIIFNDATALARANAIVHPAVTHDFLRWCNRQYASFLFLESAILHEAGLAPLFDAIITVVADLETRIDRVTRRNGVPPGKVLERTRHQVERAPAFPALVVRNNPGDMILEQVLNIIQALETWQG
jgi:dephospho-CoA kinase